MDFKKLAVFIRVLGLIVLGYGGLKWATNQSKPFEAPQETQSWDRYLANQKALVEDSQIERARDGAVKIMIAGGVILFVGFSISSSTKKSPSA